MTPPAERVEVMRGEMGRLNAGTCYGVIWIQSQ